MRRAPEIRPTAGVNVGLTTKKNQKVELCKGKGKGKVHPITGHEGPEGE